MSTKIDLNTKNQWKDNETPLSAENLNTMLNGIIDNKNKLGEVDQTYQPTSANPQSGKAVKQAIDNAIENQVSIQLITWEAND